ncbi:phosphatase PAP2 family protein [Janibacter hoylei]|uniref:phosphatase PAP2 family protein n=1 Tax=Janibacter hoylei TaxID=364298 RepID=UPI002238C9E0|nr:phosphatase PAP2 family protein [Janibacter hoylei]MCW4601461.1 phosphatase PAP2 family protein [Janibacter hoylei]
MPPDYRVSARRVVVALGAMSLAMLVVAALGRWVLIPADWARALDEGGVAAGTDLVLSAPWLGDVARAWSALSGPWVVHPLVVVVAVTLWVRGRVGRSVLVVPAIGLVGWALGAVCKEIVQRARPEDAVVSYGSWSYPSGHATNAALGAVLLIALLTLVATVWIRWGATLLVVVATALTAADRIVLGVHYVSDVAAGLVLGSALALVGLRCFPFVLTLTRRPPTPHLPRKSPPSVPSAEGNTTPPAHFPIGTPPSPGKWFWVRCAGDVRGRSSTGRRPRAPPRRRSAARDRRARRAGT